MKSSPLKVQQHQIRPDSALDAPKLLISPQKVQQHLTRPDVPQENWTLSDHYKFIFETLEDKNDYSLDKENFRVQNEEHAGVQNEWSLSDIQEEDEDESFGCTDSDDDPLEEENGDEVHYDDSDGRKAPRTKIDNFFFSFVNTQTLLDTKIPEINNETLNDHLVFFNELNIRDKEHLNIVTSDIDYEWVIIKEHDIPTIKQRIGLRYPRSLSGPSFKVKVLEEDYLTQDVRCAAQQDKSVVQYMVLKVEAFHLTLKILLVYRLGDASEENTNFIFDTMERHSVHMSLGDYNLNFKEKEIKNVYKQKTFLQQIIKVPTRYGVGRNNSETSTIIDHVWVRPAMVSKIEYDVKSVTFTDHEMIKLSIDARIPCVRTRIPIPLNIHRRYFPKKPIDWSKFPTPDNIHDGQIVHDIEQFYGELQASIRSGCEKMGITFRQKPIYKKVFRFEFRKETSKMKKVAKDARMRWRKATKILLELKEINLLYPIPAEIATQECLVNTLKIEKNIKRNRYNTMVKSDRRKFFNSKMTDRATTTKECWKLVNRSKGQVKAVVEDLDEPDFQAEEMAKFFKKRSLLAVKDDTDLSIDFSFPYKGSENLRNIDIKIDNEIIDDIMKYKPSPDPDPDTLSMLIWNKLYFFNDTYKALIRYLFNLVFKKFYKIPGLALHDVKLFLKVDKPTEQKHLRPVASLPSIPKRMMRILYKQLKDEDKSIFYHKTDYSCPGRGTQHALINTYEAMERGISRYKQNNKNANFKTTLTLFDKSNAFNTTSRSKMIENLPIGGSARNLVCNAIVDHKFFRVRTNKSSSNPYQLVTGGAQGQCGVAENFSSLTKLMTIPEESELEEIEGRYFMKKCDFVDDNSNVNTALVKSIDKLNQICEEKVANSCKELLLKLNEGKTKRLIIGQKPKVTEEFLGAVINNFATSHDTIVEVVKQLEKAVRATRSCSSLTKPHRMHISRLQMYSRLGLLPFMYIYASDAKRQELRKAINLNFKKGSYLSMRTPTEMVERYLYGMDFESYCQLRMSRLFEKMEKDESDLLNDVKIARGAYRPEPTAYVGSALKLYIDFKNKKFNNYPSNEKKKEIKKLAYKELIKFKHIWNREN